MPQIMKKKKKSNHITILSIIMFKLSFSVQHSHRSNTIPVMDRLPQRSGHYLPDVYSPAAVISATCRINRAHVPQRHTQSHTSSEINVKCADYTPQDAKRHLCRALRHPNPNFKT